MATKPETTNEIKVDPKALYLEEIFTDQRARVTKLLEENRDVVVALRDALIARDELIGEEIVQTIEIAISSRD